MSRILAAAAGAALLFAHSIANAAEVKVWTARAIATVLAEVGPEFERKTGNRLDITSDLPTGFASRVEAGEPFDLFISTSAAVDEWIAANRVAADTRTDIARSGIGVAVRAGASKPDISSVDAFKRALLDAKSIAFLRVGSGLYVADLLEQLGIAQAVSSKVTRPDSDAVAQLVASGEVELGLVVITQILTTPGVELVGPLPPEIQSTIMFTAGASTSTRAPDAVRQLIDVLIGPTAAPVIRAQGMEPAHGAGAGEDSREEAAGEGRRSSMLLDAETELDQKRPEDAIDLLDDLHFSGPQAGDLNGGFMNSDTRAFAWKQSALN